MVKHKSRLLLMDGNKRAFSFEAFLNPRTKTTNWNQRAHNIYERQPEPSSSGTPYINFDSLPLKNFTLAAYHAEFERLTTSDTRNQQMTRNDGKLRSSPTKSGDPDYTIEFKEPPVPLVDSMAIYILGPHKGIRRQGMVRHALQAASWPQEAIHSIDGGFFKFLQACMFWLLQLFYAIECTFIGFQEHRSVTRDRNQVMMATLFHDEGKRPFLGDYSSSVSRTYI